MGRNRILLIEDDADDIELLQDALMPTTSASRVDMQYAFFMGADKFVTKTQYHPGV